MARLVRACSDCRAALIEIWHSVRTVEAIGQTIFRERDRWYLWLPVAIGAGVASYFALPVEPSWMAAASPLLVSFVAMFVVWLRPNYRQTALGVGMAGTFVLAFAAVASFGIVVAKARTELVRAPIITNEIGPVEVVGQISEIWPQISETGRTSWRMTLRPHRVGGLEPSKLPYKVRLTLRSDASSLQAGTWVVLRAVVMPLPTPARPQGFDFARKAWFERLGGLGYGVGEVKAIDPPREPNFVPLKVGPAVTVLRHRISQRIQSQVSGDAGAVAAALIVGDRHGIPPDTAEAFRATGVAHLLAISGLHMAMVAGMAFFVFRFLFAAIPSFALRFPIKKWAAVLGLATAVIYLFLSGASVSTQRAFVMISLMFIAVLTDRQAISMRTVSTAALVILVIAPESLMEVGFQMSFAAVVALIAIYEYWNEKRRITISRNGPFVLRLGRGVGLYFWGVAATSLIAGLGTGFFATYHFNRIATFGLMANLAVMPFVSVLIMPAIFFALVLLPFGWEGVALKSMDFGITMVIKTIDEIRQWPAAEQYVTQWPALSLYGIVVGGLWLAIWRRSWRMLGLLPMAAGGLMLLFPQGPDVFVDRDGKNIALITRQGELDTLFPRRAKFAQESWARSRGIVHGQHLPDRSRFKCDVFACVAELHNGIIVSYILDRRAFEEECQSADIVVSSFSAPRRLKRWCEDGAAIIDRRALREGGAHAINLTSNGFELDVANDHRGRRPWTN